MRILWALFVLILLPPIALAQQRPADCAAPRGAILPGNQAMQYCDALAAQVHELRAIVFMLQDNLRNGGYSGPPGPQGPPGQRGEPGESAAVDLRPIVDRLLMLERWITAVEARIDKVIEKRAIAKPPDAGLETPPVNGPSAPALPNGQQGRTEWIEDVLRPVAAVVGNAYAGPVGGAMLTSALGGIAWLIGRKKKES